MEEAMGVETNPSEIIGDINTVPGSQYKNEKEKMAALMRLQRGKKKCDKKIAIIVKETDMFIDYMNSAGTKIRIPKQEFKAIQKSILANLNNSDTGSRLEAEVANYLVNNTDTSIVHFSNKVKNLSGQVIGDIDCATQNVLIEVKNSISSVKIKQLNKYVDDTNAAYFNVENKKVILYINDKLDLSNANNVLKLQEIEKMGITVVNGLEQLKGAIH